MRPVALLQRVVFFLPPSTFNLQPSPNSAAGRFHSRHGDGRRLCTRERAGFSSGPENKIFSPRCAVADKTAYTHGHCVLHLTKVNRVSQAGFPPSHQYWGQVGGQEPVTKPCLRRDELHETLIFGDLRTNGLV